VGGDTTTTTVLTPSSTTTPGTGTTTIPGSTTTSTAVQDQVVAAWSVFFAQTPDGSPTGNPALVPFVLYITEQDDVPFDLVDSPEDMLVNLEKLPLEIPEGFFSSVPADVEIVDKTFSRTDRGLNRVTLDMNEAFLAGGGGLLADFTMLNQLIYTALQNDVDEVVFTVGGEPIEAFGMEGLSLVDPVDGTTFRDELSPIFLTSAVTADGEEYQVYGVANVFEAVVSYRVPGTDVAGFVMATCGTGCWGGFDFTIPRAEVPEGAVLELFADSAEDGSPMFVISVPLDPAIRNSGS
jgi:hypothetical protein